MRKTQYKIESQTLIPRTKNVEYKQSANGLLCRYIRTGRGGSNSRPIRIPKMITVTPQLATAIGIYYAEGNKSVNRWYSSFSNTETKIILSGIVMFQILGIVHEQLKAHIKTYNHKMTDNQLIDYWSGQTGIPHKNFIKVSRAHSKITYVRNRKTPPATGLLEIYHSSVIIRDIIDALLRIIKELSLKNKTVRRAFLRGMFSGEGSVKLVHNKLREIRIASCSKPEQSFIRTLLFKEGIRPSDAQYKYYIAISGICNFSKLRRLEIIDIHPEKKSLFDTGYKNALFLSGE